LRTPNEGWPGDSRGGRQGGPNSRWASNLFWASDILSEYSYARAVDIGNISMKFDLLCSGLRSSASVKQEKAATEVELHRCKTR
jgi:hypothetical protein